MQRDSDDILIITAPQLELVPAFRTAIAEGFTGPSVLMAKARADDRAFMHLINNPPPHRLTADGRQVENVPHTLFWLHNGRDKFYGNASLRHYLSEETEKFGGHIGYSVHPYHHNKGYASLLLQHAIKIAREKLRLTHLLMTIDESNAPSCRVAEKAGFVHTQTIKNPLKPNVPHRHYWLTLD